MFARILAVARRDFLAVVRTKGFLIGLLFMPAVMLASVGVPRLLERFGERGERRFAVADFTGRLAEPLLRRIDERNAQPGQKLRVVLEPVDLAARGIRPQEFAVAREGLANELAQRVRREELFGYVLIGPRVAEVPPPGGGDPALSGDAVVVYGAVSLTSGELRQTVRGALDECVRQERLASAGLDPELVARVDRRAPFEEFVVSRAEGAEGAVRSSGRTEALVPIGIMILLMMGIMQSAGLLLNATIEEKSNRVVEVLVSSVSPFELLAGKILGAWLTGLVVLLAWGGAAVFAADHFGILRAGLLSPANLAWDLYFFVAGYLLFASLYGAIGAMCSSIQDAQNMILPVALLLMIPMLGMAHVFEHPDSVITTALCFFPFSGAMLLPMRLSQQPPPSAWLIGGSALSVAVTAFLLVWAAGKIFRTAILMTGKPPRPSEVWRMLREA
jgi:ABC-2 type transport system permease protein